jgi:hypothetical protein
MLEKIPTQETDRSLLLYTACIADTILQPLYYFIQRRNFLGYIDALHEIARWASEFYNEYHHLFSDWDEFEESELNVYNSSSWDEFLIFWANDRLKKFKSLYRTTGDPLNFRNLQHGGAKAAKLVIVINNNKLSAVYSNIHVQVAHLVADNSAAIPFRLIGFFNADALADHLYTLFDQEDGNQSSIRELLRKHSF